MVELSQYQTNHPQQPIDLTSRLTQHSKSQFLAPVSIKDEVETFILSLCQLQTKNAWITCSYDEIENAKKELIDEGRTCKLLIRITNSIARRINDDSVEINQSIVKTVEQDTMTETPIDALIIWDDAKTQFEVQEFHESKHILEEYRSKKRDDIFMTSSHNPQLYRSLIFVRCDKMVQNTAAMMKRLLEFVCTNKMTHIRKFIKKMLRPTQLSALFCRNFFASIGN